MCVCVCVCVFVCVCVLCVCVCKERVFLLNCIVVYYCLSKILSSSSIFYMKDLSLFAEIDGLFAQDLIVCITLLYQQTYWIFFL